MKISVALKTLLGAASLALPLTAFAESNVVSGAASPLVATAHVDLTITIPAILYLRVGTGSSYTTGVLAANPVIDVITFAPTAAQLGNPLMPVAGTGGDPSAGPGMETAAIVSNRGSVTLAAATAGVNLLDPAGDTIPFTQIGLATATKTSATALPIPAMNGNVVIPAPASHVIVQDAIWTYTYLNATVPAVGTYGAIVANNSRVTYTATMP